MKSLEELLTTNKEKTKRWLIENLIGMGELAILYGDFGTHKTGIAIKIALEIITGGKDLGQALTGNVLYYSLDSPEMDFVPRVIALAENRYPDRLEEIGLNLKPEYGKYCNAADFNLLSEWKYQDEFDNNNDDGMTWFTAGEFDQDDNFKLIIIDTLSKAIVGGGINDDQALRKVIHNCRNWIKGADDSLSILLVHHTGKNGRKGMMGSSILSNDISTVLRVRKKKDGFDLVREKHKSPHEGKSIPFKGRGVLVKYADVIIDSVYVDIGSTLDEFNAEIVSQFRDGLTKEKIKGNIKMLGLGNTTTDKSFATVFNRRWKKLIDTGFINNKKQGNKT
ncbi:AAA family ATPase [Gammaproteobacteria bacterium]|nr:AAA family ATPase [Gammaproteobacteria bacterium]